MLDLIETLDPDIRHTVQWLREHGFQTTDSGDGVSKFQGGAPDTCALPFPHVAIVVSPDQLQREADRLFYLIESSGIDVHATLADDPSIPVVNIEATYYPRESIAMILLTGVSDKDIVGVR